PLDVAKLFQHLLADDRRILDRLIRRVDAREIDVHATPLRAVRFGGQAPARRSAMRSKKPDHPCAAPSYTSGGRLPRCSKSILVRPSPRSVRTTTISSYASSPDWSESVNTSRSGSTTSRNSPFQRISRRSGPANIFSRHAPPGLTSIETVDSGTSDSPPPNQSAKRSGSVHSRHTRSRGASKTRVIVVPGSLMQTLVEAVEASLPEATVRLEPVGRVLQRRPLQVRGPELRRPPARDQPRPLEHLQV